MKVQFFVNTPFHAHLYRNAAKILAERKNNSYILARDHGCTLNILDYYNLDYHVYGSANSLSSIFRDLPHQYINIANLTRKIDPDLIFGIGGGGYSIPGGIFSRTLVVTFWSGEAGETTHSKLFKLQKYLFMPFRSAVVSPATDNTVLGNSHYHTSSTLEFAYLHPNYFPYSGHYYHKGELQILLRFNSFSASHDMGISGFSDLERNELVNIFSRYGKVIVSDEGNETVFNNETRENFMYFNRHPAELHKAIAKSDLIISDGQTVIREGAAIGTPGIRYNSFVNMETEGIFPYLEQRGLIKNLSDFESVIDTAEVVLTDASWKESFVNNHQKYLSSSTDLTKVIVDVAKSYPDLDGVIGLKKHDSN